MASELDVFASVFPSSSFSHTTPTPLSTPLIGSTGSFGTSPSKQAHNSSASQLQIRRNLAWSAATRYLSLDGITPEEFLAAQKHVVTRRRKTREVEEALELLLSGDGAAGQTNEEWDLVTWYGLEVRTHFLANLAPEISHAWSKPIPADQIFSVIEDTVKKLGQIQELYKSRLLEDIIPAVGHSKRRRGSVSAMTVDSETAIRRQRVEANFQRKLQALFLHAFPSQRLSNALSFVMHRLASGVFHLDSAAKDDPALENVSADQASTLFGLLEHLQAIGLGDDFGQRAFALAMWKLMDDFVGGHWMKVDWENQMSRIRTLTRWINHGLVPFIHKAIFTLAGTPDDACQYQKMTVARLGRSRITHLFDHILRWDYSLGAIRDIKEYINTPEARLYLTNNFSDQVSRRLLHAGATTTHILNLYINIIHAFNELDSKGVLLDRVAKPIRRYLRQREDTARIIVTSLLVDVDEVNNRPDADVSIEIANEMSKPILGVDADEDYDLDFDNMNWMPDPMDAGPDFKRSKNQDILTALLSLYDREDFINELKTILGDHLLRNYDINEHFENEERFLELFKNRLGEDKLQSCEVMLRDVQSSHQMNKAIHRHPTYGAQKEQSGDIDLNAHILSSFFWPSLKEDEFHVPEAVHALQEEYEKGFEAIKDMRKLKWLTALGRATVELEFEDRKVEEEVPTWTASVIYAFQSEDGEPVTKTVEQLEEELEMDEPLIRNAITFWRSKQVLRETAPNSETYTTIEDLAAFERRPGAQDNAPLVEEDAAVSAVRSQQDLLNENAELYKNVITGMLTNQGNLPLMRVFMMMKIVVPGFGFGVEEVRGLLQGMVEEGRLVGQGDVYGITKD